MGSKPQGTPRFSKSLCLQALEQSAATIAEAQAFDRGNGTSQLWPRHADEAMKNAIDRAVQYGRMRAFEQFAELVDDNRVCDAVVADKRKAI